jgi:tyrosinase
MSDHTEAKIATMSEKQPLASHHTDLESQSPASPPPARPVFIILWLLFVLGTIATIISSNWANPSYPIHAQHVLYTSKSAISTTSPLPISAPTSTCDNLTLRREWRSLKHTEQARYQTAMRCLLELPSKNGQSGSVLGDLMSAYMTSGWHATSTTDYLPWNRWFMHTLEASLRRECGYTGDMPYLDWTAAAPVTAKHSTDGKSPNAQSYQSTFHDQLAKQRLDAALVSKILSAPNYDAFARVLESHITDLAPLGLGVSETPQGLSLFYYKRFKSLN